MPQMKLATQFSWPCSMFLMGVTPRSSLACSSVGLVSVSPHWRRHHHHRHGFPSENWRRRPDLNRGWRFCRQGRDAYLVDSSCFLVGPTTPFSPVFGRNCSQVVPKPGDLQRVERCQIFLPPTIGWRRRAHVLFMFPACSPAAR
jgi:hypothetical protein